MMTARTERSTEPPALVYTDRGLAQMIQRLQDQPAFALDTESNSFYVYYPQVCLIQITTHADSPPPDTPDADALHVADFLVDPLRLSDLSPLGELIATGRQEIIMHAAENDILQLQRDFGFRFPRVFDTQLAARILGWEKVGLGAILEEWFGVVSDKRMQRTDWAVRPLTPQQIAYAQMDTHYLIALRNLLTARLVEMGRWDEAQDAFVQLSRLDANGKTPVARSFWQMKVAHSVELKHTGTLEALWEWREKEAQRLNRPPFKVLSDEALAEIATARPATAAQLHAVRGINSQQVARFGEGILAAVADGVRRPRPELPRPTLRPELMLSNHDQNRFERLRRWRTEKARARGVAPEIVFNNDTLLEIVQRSPTTQAGIAGIPGMSPWKAAAYGPELLEILNGGSPG